MINKGLVRILLTNNTLTNIQCGFRKNRSPIEQLVRLETLIRDAFVDKYHAVSEFFDLEKAYHLKYGKLQDLPNIGF